MWNTYLLSPHVPLARIFDGRKKKFHFAFPSMRRNWGFAIGAADGKGPALLVSSVASQGDSLPGKHFYPQMLLMIKQKRQMLKVAS